jgi:hypothetical protein
VFFSIYRACVPESQWVQFSRVHDCSMLQE